MNVTVNTTDTDCYLDILKLIRTVPPFNKLRDAELQVLSKLIYWYHYYEGTPEDVRNIMTFDYDTRIKIVNDLGITQNAMNTYLYRLRKYGFVKNRTLVMKFPNLKTVDSIDINFKVKISHGEKENMVNDHREP